MNHVVLQGLFHSAPELRYTQDGLAWLSVMLIFPAAKVEEPEHTLRVIFFGEQAEQLHSTAKQGDPVIVEGRLQSDSHLRPDGSKERTTELIARRIHFLAAPKQVSRDKPLEAPPRSGPALPSPQAAAARMRRPPAPTTRPLAAVGSEDDLPF